MVTVHYGTINQELQQTADGTLNNVLPDFSETEFKSLLKNFSDPKYIYFDGLGIDLNDNDKQFYQSGSSEYVGVASNEVSSENCGFENPLTIKFDNAESYSGDVTIKFYGECCEQVSLHYKRENNEEYVFKQVNSDVLIFPFMNSVNQPINEIKFIETVKPYQRIKISYIKFGDTIVFDQIKHTELLEEINVISNDLPINSFDFTVALTDEQLEKVDFKSGNTINVYSNDTYFGTFYLDDFERVSKYVYNIKSYNSVNTLENTEFLLWGKRKYESLTNSEYLEYFMSAKDFFGDGGIIPKTSGVRFESSEPLQNYYAWGHIPRGTARFATCAFAFSCGFIIDSSRNDKIVIKKIPTLISSVILTDDERIIGDAKYTRNKDISKVIYQYPGPFVKDTNNQPISHLTVTNETNDIDIPVKVYFENTPSAASVSSSGTRIINNSYNYIEFTNVETLPTTIQLTKLNFSNTSKESYLSHTEGLNNELKFDKFNVRGIEAEGEITLGTSLIDQKLNDLSKYAKSGGTISAKIRLRNERVGDLIQIETAFDGIKTGIITSMNIHFGYENTADIEVLEWQIG